MNDSITREQAEERLKADEWVAQTIKDLLATLFPPPFIPKEGEVIAVKSQWAEGWLFRTFIKIVDSRYSCVADGEPSSTESSPTLEWDIIRPLTDKERRL